MTTIASGAALLRAAVQDLHAGYTDAASRLPVIAVRTTDGALRAILAGAGTRAAEQATRLVAAGLVPVGPRNLWMEGILDDAERDGRSTEPGRLLDIALVGAIRKAMAASIVSNETAIALARETEDAALADAVALNLGEAVAIDRALKDRLAVLTR